MVNLRSHTTRLGVLDIGSNTIHMLIVDAAPGARPDPEASTKSTVRLMKYLKDDGSIKKSGIEAILEAVSQCMRLAEEYEITQLLVMATSALREAPNGNKVIHKIEELIGQGVTVLSGTDEARLTFLAARRWYGWVNTVNVFYWFNPIIWYFLKRIRQERELACDSAVLQLLKETEYKSYGNTLINFAETIALSPFPFTMGISGNIKQLKGRILNIASFHQPTFKQKIRGYLICIFVSTIIIGCIPILSVYASDQTGYHFDTTEKNITQLNLSSNFGDYTGSFVLYNQSADKWNIYNMEHASTRVSPNSTYKIYDALLGLESGIITPEHSTFTWNGEPYPFHSWEADQDLTSAIHNSVNWYFQAIDSQAGFEAVRTFLQTINYGNQNTGTNLNLYWTDFSLKISPIEQVELLQDFYQNHFHFDSKNIQAVKKALLLSTTSSGSLYGKTGTGRVNGKDVNGWFIGYIETANNTYYFATNIQSSSGATGSQATEITESVLSNLGIWK